MIKLDPNDMAKLTRKLNQLKVINKSGVPQE